MSGSTGVWILYIWIFVLVWKAVCLQGAVHTHSRQRRSHGEDQTENVMMENGSRRSLNENVASALQSTQGVVTGTGPVVSGEGASVNTVGSPNVPPPLEVTVSGGTPAEIASDTRPNVPRPLDSDPGTRASVPEPLETVPMLASTTKHRGHKASIPTLAVISEMDSSTTPPLDTGQQRTEVPTAGLSPPEQQQMGTPRKHGEGSVKAVSDKSTTLHFNEQPSDQGQDVIMVIGAGDINVASGADTSGSQDTRTQTPEHTAQKHRPDAAAVQPQTASDATVISTLQNQNQNSIEGTQNTHQLVASPLNFVRYTDVMMGGSINDSEHSKKHLDRLAHLHEKQKQNLVLLQNATEQADAIQKTLRTHKIKLKSYMEVLKNLTVQHATERKLVNEYAQSVRDKVNDILNPKRHLDNHTKPDKPPGQKPQHFLAKNITETLRARVDMDNLKKSEAFWDRKGEDVEEPRLLKDALHFENSMVSEEAHILTPLTEDQLSDGGIREAFNDTDDIGTPQEADDTQTDIQTTADDEQKTEVYDVHQARLDEIRVTRDRLSGRTGHESLVYNQIVSGRIHGNILAPPPERCSVQANMRRYRPPEEGMDEAESLLYRVDLQPEYENSLEGGPMNYLPDYRNPCWLSRITDDRGSLWYDYTESGLTYKRMSFLYEMRLSKDSNWRMRCLPLLYFVGVTKSGTTDLYTRLMGHPEIMRPAHKEPMWWNRLTLGMAQSLRKSFRYYLDFFDEAAELMRRKVVLKEGKPYHPGITVDATPANLWDYDCWTDIPGNRGLSEPKYTLAHSIRKLVPNAKILMILREPTDRLYSQYRMKSHREPSYTFHRQVLETLVNFNECLQTRTLRSCAYDDDLSKHEFGSPGGVFIRASLYYVFAKDWLDVFPREQVKVLRSEDYHNDTAGTLVDVIDFLGLSPLTPERLTAVSKQRAVNTRADHLDRSLEPILPETQRLLDDFFRPYNRMLAKLLKDKRFKWNDVRGPARK